MGDNFNPYQAPRADGEQPQQSFDGYMDDASKGVRFANLLIDSVFRGIIGAVMGVIAGIAKEPSLSIVLSLGSMIGYYLFFEGVFQATPGKMITRTKVVSREGGKPSFGQILGRTFSRFVPFEPFSFLGNLGDGWHDRWSGTRVVRR